jgi:hypothetical protein
MRSIRQLVKHSSVLLGAGLMAMNLAVSSTAWAAACATASLATYTTAGFNCTIDDLKFSSFSYYTNWIASNPYSTINGPADILVTPENVSGEKGFAFSNLNLRFTGGGSNTYFSASFNVDALTGLINDAILQLDTHSFTNGTSAGYGGYNFLTFGDGSNFGLYATDGNYAGTKLTDSSNFTGVASLTAFSSADSGVSGFKGGSAFTDGYTVLLSTAAVAAVPEPEIYAMLGVGLGLMGWVGRRKKLQAA